MAQTRKAISPEHRSRYRAMEAERVQMRTNKPVVFRSDSPNPEINSISSTRDLLPKAQQTVCSWPDWKQAGSGSERPEAQNRGRDTPHAAPIHACRHHLVQKETIEE